MKTSNWSIIGIATGIVFALFSALRYFVLFPDTDKAIVYVIVGILICAVSWLYNKQLNQGNTIEAVEIYLADKPKGEVKNIESLKKNIWTTW